MTHVAEAGTAAAAATGGCRLSRRRCSAPAWEEEGGLTRSERSEADGAVDIRMLQCLSFMSGEPAASYTLELMQGGWVGSFYFVRAGARDFRQYCFDVGSREADDAVRWSRPHVV